MLTKKEFFKNAIIGFLNDIKIVISDFNDVKNFETPVYIKSTGDEVFDNLLTDKINVTDKQITNKVPRMVFDIGGFTVLTDQMSNPNVHGNFIITNSGFSNNYVANVKRIPLELGLTCEVVFDNILDFFTFTEVILTNSYKTRTYRFLYNGYEYEGNYSFDDSLNSDVSLVHSHDSERRQRKLPLTFILNLQYPAFDNASKMISSNTMKKLTHNTDIDDYTETVEIPQ